MLAVAHRDRVLDGICITLRFIAMAKELSASTAAMCVVIM